MVGEQAAPEPFADMSKLVNQGDDAIPQKHRKSFRKPSLMAQMPRLDLNQFNDGESTAAKYAVCVLHPFSEMRYGWDLIVLMFMAYSSVILPLQFADLTGASGYREVTGLLIFDQISNTIFVIDLMLNFRTGYLDVKSRTVILDPRRMAQHCANTPSNARDPHRSALASPVCNAPTSSQHILPGVGAQTLDGGSSST